MATSRWRVNVPSSSTSTIHLRVSRRVHSLWLGLLDPVDIEFWAGSMDSGYMDIHHTWIPMMSAYHHVIIHAYTRPYHQSQRNVRLA